MKKSKDQKSFKPVFNLYDENACDAIKKYLGDFIVEMQKSAGIEPGTCPVPKVRCEKFGIFGALS